MSFPLVPDPAPGDAAAADAIDLVIVPRSVDLGGFAVRRALPHVEKHRGCLLATSSLAAFAHSPLCDSIRLEVRHLGVDVGSAHPTFFRTPMMDDVVADPAGRQLWGGNDKRLFKMVPIDTIVNAIVDGIEKRAKRIVAPKSLAATEALRRAQSHQT